MAMPYSRRRFIRKSGAALAIGAIGFPSIVRASVSGRKCIVLGVDAMDPTLLFKYMGQGLMPNCKRLIDAGMFSTIRTSDPPQSPVAWSNFVAGTNPGGHGIFDFIARDSSTILPYLSTARTYPPRHEMDIGKFSIPFTPGKTELLRKGPTLWDVLERHGVESLAFRVPVNFPPTESDARTLSGITTPDIHGGYGIFTLFTSEITERTRKLAGGRIQRIAVEDGTAQCTIGGPPNTYGRDHDEVTVGFTVNVDPERSLARVNLPDASFVLKAGEWSDWQVLRFPMIRSVVEATGICRFYLKRVHPHLELYASPVNIDPSNPAMPVSTPTSYSRKLVEEVGNFYTQGMPEDTAALNAGVFSDDEFRVQSTFVLNENLAFLRHELNRFRDGFFYLYFSTLDLNSHAFWRVIDEGHPLHTPELAARHGDFMPWLYGQIDGAVGEAMQLMDDKTLFMVVSDHGFVSFRRQFNLNSWLLDNGYAKLKNPVDRGETELFQDTDWSGTTAYGLGINSLYLNIRGREPDGIVNSGDDALRLREKLIAHLKSVRDPKTGEPVITNVFRPEDIYSGPYVKDAPDLIVGYNRHYRASWESILGKYPREVIGDNLMAWSGDHCMDKQFLSGVLACNRKFAARDPELYDLPTTILNFFGVPVPREMIGRNLFGKG